MKEFSLSPLGDFGGGESGGPLHVEVTLRWLIFFPPPGLTDELATSLTSPVYAKGNFGLGQTARAEDMIWGLG